MRGERRCIGNKTRQDKTRQEEKRKGTKDRKKRKVSRGIMKICVSAREEC